MPVSFDLVVAYTRKMGIGNNGTLPWPRLSKDMAHFVDKTKTAPPGMMNAVVMGRKTWDSIPLALRPLKDRYNIVVTSQADITYVLSVQHGLICHVPSSSIIPVLIISFLPSSTDPLWPR